MASSNSMSLVLLLAVVFVASSFPSANSILFNGLNVAGIQVEGRAFCSSTGNPTGPALGGAAVSLTCNGSPTVLGQAMTDPLGRFLIALTNLPAGISLVPSASIPCVATVRLPVIGCLALPNTGVIRAEVVLSANVLRIDVGLVVAASTGTWVVAAS